MKVWSDGKPMFTETGGFFTTNRYLYKLLIKHKLFWCFSLIKSRVIKKMINTLLCKNSTALRQVASCVKPSAVIRLWPAANCPARWWMIDRDKLRKLASNAVNCGITVKLKNSVVGSSDSDFAHMTVVIKKKTTTAWQIRFLLGCYSVSVVLHWLIEEKSKNVTSFFKSN